MPKPPTITREQVVAVALEVIDTVGLDQFSLGAVAAKLNVRVPSLYYYFRDRSELLANVARSILLEAEATIPRSTDNWKHALVYTGLEVRRSLLRHPKAAALLLIFPPHHVVIGGYERAFRFMEKAGIPADQRLDILAGLDYIAWGSMLFEAMSRSTGVPTYPKFDPHQYRGLAAAMDANDKDDEQLYLQACFAFLAGYETERPDILAKHGRVEKKPARKKKAAE